MKHNRILQILALTILVALAGESVAKAGPPRGAKAVDLDTALELAREHSPILDSANAGVGQARGDLTTSKALLADGTYVQLGLGPRLSTVDSPALQPQFQAFVRQRFEIAGQRRKRIRAAREELDAAEYDRKDTQRRLDLLVAEVFLDGLAAEERLRLAKENEALVAGIRDVAQTRLDAGADSPTALNAAKIRVAEARRKTLAAEADAAAARVELAAAVGLSPSQPLIPKGVLPDAADIPDVEKLVARVANERPDLLASSRRTNAAAHGEALARSQRWPDLSLGARYSFEEQDNVIMGTVGFWLPTLNRNRGQRQRARATTERRRAEASTVELRVEAEIRASSARLTAASKAASVYDAGVLTTHSENLRLLREQYSEGKVTYVELVLLQRELLEAQLGYVQARVDVAKARVAVESAAGLQIGSWSEKGTE